MRQSIPKDWVTWHCEELTEIDCVWVDQESKVYAECPGFPCFVVGRCLPIPWQAKEIKVFADQNLVLINPLPDDEREFEVEEPKIGELKPEKVT